jgi:hypothetical protein
MLGLLEKSDHNKAITASDEADMKNLTALYFVNI